MERSPLQRLACQYGEPDFDLIEPGSAGRGKVEMDVLMPGQPAVAFRLMGVEIIKNDMDFATLLALTMRFMKSRNSMRRRRLYWRPVTTPVAISKAANSVVVPWRL